MKRLGAAEARRRFGRLLDEAASGESLVITRHGRPVALLTPAARAAGSMPVSEAVAGLRQFRTRHPVGGDSFRDLIDSGRRR